MKESTKQPAPEVDLNPHSDLPPAGLISTEITVARVSDAEPAARPLPFGVYLGTPAAPATEPLKP